MKALRILLLVAAAAIAGAYLAFAGFGALFVLLLDHLIQQACPKDLQSFVFVFQLRFFILAGDHHTGWQVGYSHG